MGKYELLYIVHPDLESSIDKITGKVRGFIEQRSGKITYEENWGKRKLAYEIKKSEVGIYVLVYFEAPKDTLAKIERDIRLTEEIIRFMALATDDKIKTPKKEKKEKVAEEKAEEKEEVVSAKGGSTSGRKKAEPKEDKEDEKVSALERLYITPPLSIKYFSEDLIISAKKIIEIKKDKIIVSDEYLKVGSKVKLQAAVCPE